MDSNLSSLSDSPTSSDYSADCSDNENDSSGSEIEFEWSDTEYECEPSSGSNLHELENFDSTDSEISYMSDDDFFDYVSKFQSESYTFIEDCKYLKVGKVGQGTFGEVYKCRIDGEDPEHFVAIKCTNWHSSNDEEISPTTFREIRVLKKLQHENIVNLIEVCRSKKNGSDFDGSRAYLVFEFCEHDLAGILKNSAIQLVLGEIRNIAYQLLTGVAFIHSQRIMHRDLKTTNILLTKEGVLKIADFGLSRAVIDYDSDSSSTESGSGSEDSDDEIADAEETLEEFGEEEEELLGDEEEEDPADPKVLTPDVVTLWYRPPEILLGDKDYGYPVDVWPAALIIAELWFKEPLFKGDSEYDQLKQISKLCGSIVPDVWPGVQELELWNKMILPTDDERTLKKKFIDEDLDPDAIDLLHRMLKLNPLERVSAAQALLHSFFEGESPLEYDLRPLLAQQTTSNFELLGSSNSNGVDQEELFDPVF